MRIVLMFASLFYLSTSFAAGSEPFTQSLFENASKLEKPVIVGFHEEGCGSCKIQKPNLQSLLKEDAFKDTTGLLAYLEDTNEFRKHLKKPVRSPSTIVVFKAGAEIGRIQGVTDKDELRSQLLAIIKK